VERLDLSVNMENCAFRLVPWLEFRPSLSDLDMNY